MAMTEQERAAFMAEMEEWAEILSAFLDEDDECVTYGGQGTVGDGGYVQCPACGTDGEVR